jgi:hypothetical protein
MALGISGGARAGDEDATYVSATYYSCSGSLKRIDELIDTVGKPVYDAAVKSGDIKGWGWLTHHTGGKWDRILYHTAGSIEQTIVAQDAIIAEIDDAAVKEFGENCGDHEDYIWKGIVGSGGNVLSTKRGEVALSAYYVCDHRETVADEIVKAVFAPLYDANVGPGKLTSWGWSEHIVGGKYRRLATMTAQDWPSLFAVRAKIVEAAGDSELAGQFGEICNSHADYMWVIEHEVP